MTTFLVYLTIGLTVGGVYAIAATGLVVTYITSRVFNFAYGSIGMLIAFCYYQMRVQWHWPTIPALIVSLFVLAPLLGALLDRALMVHLQSASVATKLVATLALSLLVSGIAQYFWGSKLRTIPPLVSANTFSPVHGLKVSYDQGCTVLVAAVVAVAMWIFLRRTKVGTTMRAVVDSPDLAELNGISPQRVTTVSWAIGTSLAGLAAILIAPQVTLSIQALSIIVVTSFAAAVIGRLRSMLWTFIGGLVIGLVSAFLTGYLPPSNKLLADLSSAAPFAIMFVVLVLFPREQGQVERTDNLEFGRPPALLTTLGWTVAGVLVAAIIAPRLSGFHAYVAATGLIFAMVLLSLVLVTGLSGQVSLAQFSFVGLGAVLMGHLARNMPYAAALVVVTILCAAVGAIVALPAVRMRGLYLALTTFAFAVMMDQVVFANPNVIPGATQTLAVPSPSLFGLHVRSVSSQIPVLAGIVGLMGVGILWIRRGAVGRAISAQRDAPQSASALGLNIVKTKVLVFAVGAGAAGFAGCLFGGIQGSVSSSEFVYTTSGIALLILVMQGVGSIAGAIVGAAFYSVAFLILPQWIHSDNVLYLVQAVGIGLGVLNLAISPAGAVAQQRKQLAAVKGRLTAIGKRRREGVVPGVVSKGSTL